MATAILALASCANDTDLSGGTPSALGDGSISFNMTTPAATRNTLTGNDAATALDNMFIVWGEKNETDGTKATEANLVFKNYVVKHDITGTGATSDYVANSTTSNTNGWEYVGVATYTENVSPNIETSNKQTIKYWDDNASSYTFTAVSALQEDIKNGKVSITKTESGSDVYGKGYTIKIGSGATTSHIYYADRQPVGKTNGKFTHDAVTLNFRHFESKVRFGIYETVPGYDVVITDVKYNNSTSHTQTTYKFGVDGDFVVAGENTQYTVTYENATSSNPNKVKVATTGKSTQTYFEGGTGILAATTGIGKASNDPTWDISGGDYTAILPNPSNKTDMTLTISYKLISEDTGEIIEVSDKTAKVPAQYCQWKSNYAYSYIFKISDKSAELYPITFDAVVVEDETGNQETIATVSEPSIATFGARTADGKTTIVNGENEYAAGDVIYATVMDGSSLANLTTSNIQLYTVETTDATNYPITEASVAHALTNTSVTTKVKATKVGTNAAGINDTYLTNEVPTEDGKTIKLDNTENTTNKRALTWTAEKDKVYAIEYIKTDAQDATKKTYTYKIVRIGEASSTDDESSDGNIQPVSLSGFGNIN